MKYQRLKLIVKQIKKNENVLDIGTDHALIPIFLVERKDNISVTAVDINDFPLKTAKENISKKGFENNINLLKSNGFKNIEPSNFTSIIISGMGGKNIIKILKQKKYSGRYLLHATTDTTLLRTEIQKMNMKISNEWLVKEGKVYNIIIEVSGNFSDVSKKDLFLGPYLKHLPESTQYYKQILKILIKNSEKSKNLNLKIIERKWLEEQIWNEKN